MAEREWAKAEALALENLEIMPRDLQLWQILSILALEKGLCQVFKKAITVPEEPEILTNFGLALMNQRQAQAALEFFIRAQKLLPQAAATNFNLGNAWGELRDYLKAEEFLLNALKIKPDFALAWQILGNVFQDQGKLKEAHQAFLQAWRCDPASFQALSSLIMNLQYIPDIGPEEIWDWHQKWAESFAYEQSFSRQLKEPLTIGYLFAYCRQHPVGSLCLNALLNHDREKFRLVGYSNAPGDSCEEKLKHHFHLWRDIRGLDDISAAQQIQADGVDILIDMAGHTQDNRLRLLSLKPAPVQLHWGVAYWNSTGLAAIDYLISDRQEVPWDSPQRFSEKIAYLPHSFICYSPPEVTPDPASWPEGPFTFGCFNRAAKLNEQVFAVWGEILKALPAARLCLQCRSFDNSAMRENIWQRLEKVGIIRERVDLVGFLPHAEIFKLYSKIHLVLDPFPWAGSIIACEGMWMGVPLVTLEGQDIAGRHAASYLRVLKLPEFIAATKAEYVEKALYWARNPEELKSLRPALRAIMQNSPLCKGVDFAKNLEELYQSLARQKCE